MTKLNFAIAEIVDIYNFLPKVLAPKVVKVAVHPSQSNRDRPSLAEQKNGNYWIVLVEANYWLLPQSGLRINQFNLATVKSLFDCQGYELSEHGDFVLLEAAQVSGMPNGTEWRLEKKGVINFDPNYPADELRSQQKQAQQEIDRLQSELEETRKQNNRLNAQVAELAYNTLQKIRADLVTRDEFIKQGRRVETWEEKLNNTLNSLSETIYNQVYKDLSQKFSKKLKDIEQKSTQETLDKFEQSISHQGETIVEFSNQIHPIFDQLERLDVDDFRGHIRLIGPRPSGKLTFLAALLCLDRALKNTNLMINIVPRNDESVRLKEQGNDLFLQRYLLSPLPVVSCCILPIYDALIEINNLNKNKSMNLNFLNKKKSMKLDFVCKPYPGEIFEFFCDTQKYRDLIDEYLQDLACVNHVILMIDVLSSDKDNYYAEGLVFLEQSLRIRRTDSSLSSYRIAVVFSKFDLSHSWDDRNNLGQYVKCNYPQVKSVLDRWYNSWNCSIEYFACSAYGRQGIADPSQWKPLGLVSPIYWLLTGKREKNLEKSGL
ncbi:coiled-coil domain-containing protein [Microcystis sp. BLCC-F210]|uniref:coiled-coil domain-containing protein n=1 Tax=Microcystis sp. BLCC-F210 TaxID=3342751 RepID=UPI0035C88019